MGMSYETFLEMLEQLKERTWYFLECNMGRLTEAQMEEIKSKVNGLLDSADDLPLK